MTSKTMPIPNHNYTQISGWFPIWPFACSYSRHEK